MGHLAGDDANSAGSATTPYNSYTLASERWRTNFVNEMGMLRVAHQAFNSKLAATRYATNVARASDELVCTLPMYEWISADDAAILKYSHLELFVSQLL